MPDTEQVQVHVWIPKDKALGLDRIAAAAPFGASRNKVAGKLLCDAIDGTIAGMGALVGSGRHLVVPVVGGETTRADVAPPAAADPTSWAARCKSAREKSGLSLRDAAERCGYKDKRSVQNLERGLAQPSDAAKAWIEAVESGQ